MNIHFICDNSRTITNDNVVVNVVIAAPVCVCVRVSVFAWRKKTHKMRSMILCRAIVTYRRVAITAEAHFVCASNAKNRAAPSQQQQQQLHTKQARLLTLSLHSWQHNVLSLLSPHLGALFTFPTLTRLRALIEMDSRVRLINRRCCCSCCKWCSCCCCCCYCCCNMACTKFYSCNDFSYIVSTLFKRVVVVVVAELIVVAVVVLLLL